eukprot:CAMPEP_0178412908 /NCGR_PEP_ID=MMETSP0689_2-20121128/22257_1 /TAXON_ID=160604 /ORGANISM="Amphidinium massartii, Strain CS-259" /LENGTH=400 /DNA_ID=CAMNT_0020034169 /DNA_START=199 /DNA_END=1401 /DNA_ORIENTATION=+
MPLQRALLNSSSDWASSVSKRQPLSFIQTGSVDNGGSAISSTRHPPQMSVFGQIRVGTPPQDFSVALDTGSGHLLLVSAGCRDVGCLAHKSYDAEQSSTSQAIPQLGAAPASLLETVPEHISLAVSTGDAEGDLLLDRVCLGSTAQGGNACADTGIVSMTSMSQTPWNIFPYDGVMGIGTVGASMEPRFNFLGNLAESGILKRNRFAVWIATEEDTEQSEITFGDFPSARLGSEILWLPVTQLEEGMWQAAMPDIYVAGAALGVCGGGGCQAAFDTGTAVLAGPPSLIQGILSRLNVQQDCSNYDNLPTLGFAFRMYVLNLERFDYVKRVGDYCYHQLMELDAAGGQAKVFLGDPFMRRYFTIFDRQSLQVGLAFSNHRDLPGSTETNAQKAARLMVNIG